MKIRRRTETHSLDGISWPQVSYSNESQGVHCNSLSGWHFMAASQLIKWRPDRVIHFLDGISWLRVSYSNGGQEQLTPWMRIHGGMSVIQMDPQRLTSSWMGFYGGKSVIQMDAQRLTSSWMGFYGGKSAIQMETRNKRLTGWMGFHGGKSAIQMARRWQRNSQTGWDFMTTCQQFESSPRAHGD